MQRRFASRTTIVSAVALYLDHKAMLSNGTDPPAQFMKCIVTPEPAITSG
jgi:hypothetical protein